MLWIIIPAYTLGGIYLFGALALFVLLTIENYRIVGGLGLGEAFKLAAMWPVLLAASLLCD